MDLRDAPADDEPAMLAIINAGAEAYRGVIPADRWHEPYMTAAELSTELAAGVSFRLCEAPDMPEGARAVGLTGIQHIRDAHLVRHAYVLPDQQGRGIGSALLRDLMRLHPTEMLVGTWAAASWAIRFYERHGFGLVGGDHKGELLRAYWNIPDRQIETSVVLAHPLFA